MIHIDDEGDIVWAIEGCLEVEDIFAQFILMDDDEFDDATEGISRITEAWNYAMRCRGMDAKEGH